MKTLLKLYISGQTSRSIKTINNLKRLVEHVPEGQCETRIIDILEHPQAAFEDHVVATPCLIKRSDAPGDRRFIGDLSRIQDLLLDQDIELNTSYSSVKFQETDNG